MALYGNTEIGLRWPWPNFQGLTSTLNHSIFHWKACLQPISWHESWNSLRLHARKLFFVQFKYQNKARQLGLNYTSTNLLQNAAKMMHGEKLCINLISSTFLSFHFSDWFWPLLQYLLVSSINIVDIWIKGKQNPFQLLIFKNQGGSDYMYSQVLVIFRLGTSR